MCTSGCAAMLEILEASPVVQVHLGGSFKYSFTEGAASDGSGSRAVAVQHNPGVS